MKTMYVGKSFYPHITLWYVDGKGLTEPCLFKADLFEPQEACEIRSRYETSFVVFKRYAQCYCDECLRKWKETHEKAHS